MRNTIARMIRPVSIALMLVILMTSLIVRIPVTLAEGERERAGELFASKRLSKMENSPADEVPASVNPATQARLKTAFGKLPLSFEPNRGQTNAQVKFLSRTPGYTLFLTSTEAVMTLRKAQDGSRDDKNQQSAVLRMKLSGANPEPKVEGVDQLPGRSHYLKGDDPREWRKDVPLYAKVRYTDVYAGVDMLYYGNQSQLEYDFIVAPFADPKVIALDFEGVDDLSLDAAGNLVLKTGAGDVIKHAPVVYQETDAVRQIVSGHYVIKDKYQVGFEVGAYDTSKPLLIDPVVQYSTFLGGRRIDEANGIAVDSAGNAYVTGKAESNDFPEEGGLGSFFGGPADVFVTKFSSDGSALVYSTLLGGRFADIGKAIAVTSDGRACITGVTGVDEPDLNANDFPTTANALLKKGETAKRLLDAFVTVLNPTGDGLVYSTFFGGEKTRNNQSIIDEGRGIAVDNTGKVYVTGRTGSFDLPIKNGFQTVQRPFDSAFIAKFNPTASTGPASLLYSSYFGCHSAVGVFDVGNAIAVDKFGIAYIVGETAFAQRFPDKSPSSLPPFQKSDPGGSSAFVAKFDCAASGNSSLIYATLLGGSGDDKALAVAVDAQQRTYITGATASSDFPLKNAFDSTHAARDAFVTKMNADGTALFYSSFLGGGENDEGNGIAVDPQGNAYVVGKTFSTTDFPILNAFQPVNGGKIDTFVVKISAVPATSVSPEILFSSFLGGDQFDIGNAIALGPKRSIFVTGNTASNNFPLTPGAFQKIRGNVGFDGFVTKIAEVNDDTIGTFRPSDLIFRLRNFNSADLPNITVGPNFYQAGDLPVTGDFNGDGVDTTGIFRSVNADGVFLLSDRTDGSVTVGVFFGQAGDLPIVGDWDGDGKDGIGVFRPAASKFFLRNKITPGPADITVTFGGVGDIPLAGDWDGDGDDTIGIYRESQHRFFLRNKFNVAADINVPFGIAGDVPVTGDWDGDGDDTVGVFRNSQHKFILRNVNTGPAALVIDFGETGDVPLAGDWDGRSSSVPPDSGVNNPSGGSSAAGEAQQFVTTCSDPDGWRNIRTIDFKISKTHPQGTVERIALWAQFDQNRRVVRLYDPDTRRWSEGIAGSNTILSNRFVKLRLAGTFAEGSGPGQPSIQVTWNVVFEEEAVLDEYKQYLRIADDAGFSTGFDEVGSWSVTR